jgi:hypothetical protein
MSLQLVIDEDIGIPIPVDALTQEAWHIQLDRATEQGTFAGFCERLATCFAVTLTECLDADLKPPTQPQIKYAMDIVRDLNVPLPSEALRFRGAMTDFLGRFSEIHKQRRSRTSGASPDE